jgi:hypothetical protein
MQGFAVIAQYRALHLSAVAADGDLDSGPADSPREIEHVILRLDDVHLDGFDEPVLRHGQNADAEFFGKYPLDAKGSVPVYFASFGRVVESVRY